MTYTEAHNLPPESYMKEMTIGLGKNSLRTTRRTYLIILLLHVLATIAYTQTGCEQAPDLIYYNGQVVTMNQDMEIFSAIAIKDDTIMQVGDDQKILELYQKHCTQKINLDGLTVLPGFNDSHCHWMSWREHICDIPAVSYTTYPELANIMNTISRNGWTSISELNFGHPEFIPDHINNALDLESRGELKVRLNGYWGTYADPGFLESLASMGIKPGHQYSKRIRTPGLKIYIDGPFGTMDLLTPQQTDELVQNAHDAGWAVAAHSVNESAMEMIISAIEKALGDEDNTDYRHRIEHAVKMNDDQLQRIKQKEIIASFQLMGPPDWPEQETFMTYISNQNPQFTLRWKDFFEQNVRSTGSTDAPFNNSPCDYSPFRVIYQAVTRMGYLNREHADWETAQRLTVEQAIKSLTIDGAYATGEEHIKGSLDPGKYADLVILSDNPLAMFSTPEDLLKIDVILTMVGGAIEFCDDRMCTSLCIAENVFDLDSSVISVSNFLEDYRPEQAFDQDLATFWGAGDFPPQWIQIDLLEEKPIQRIELITSQWPAGKTMHQILGSRDFQQCDLNLIWEFSGETKDGDILVYQSPNSPDTLRYVRIVTTESPSFVSWFEVKVEFSDGTVSTFPMLESNHDLDIFPSPVHSSFNVTFELGMEEKVLIELLNLHGQRVKVLWNEILEIGRQNLSFDAVPNLSKGLYLIRLTAGDAQYVRKVNFY